MKVNLNQCITFKLTASGAEAYCKHFGDALGPVAFAEAGDEKRMQLWEAFQVFGPNTYWGGESFCQCGDLEVEE